MILELLEQQFATAQHERDEYRRLYLEMMEKCRMLERGLLGSKSEHLSKDGPQLSFDVLSMVLNDRQRAELEAALAAANAEQEIPAATRPARVIVAEHPSTQPAISPGTRFVGRIVRRDKPAERKG